MLVSPLGFVSAGSSESSPTPDNGFSPREGKKINPKTQEEKKEKNPNSNARARGCATTMSLVCFPLT